MKNNTKLTTAILALPLSIALQSGNVMAADTTEVEPNNTIGTAQNIDNDFSVGANPDIQDAATWPWVSIGANGDGTNDYYAFEVPAAGVTGVFDIDYGSVSGGSIDAELCLYAADGTVLAANDDSSTANGAGGSLIGLDSYIQHAFAAPGTYVIGVGEFNVSCNPGGIVGNMLDAGDTYELQVSLSQQVVDSPQVVDTDGDGVIDDEDLCHDTAPGEAVDAVGCSDAQVDGDGDGVCNDGAVSDGPSACVGVDACPGTVIPEAVPTVKLGTNRWALVDDDFEFDTTDPKGKGPGRSYSTADTDGCSCEQIIAALDLGKGHEKFGCSISAMDAWVALPR